MGTGPAGTAAGLLAAVAVFAAVPRGWWEVPVLALLGALLPVLSRRGYGFQTAAVTPVILLLSDLSNLEGASLVGQLMADSLIGCAIALVAGHALWPGVRRTARTASTAAQAPGTAEPARVRPAGGPIGGHMGSASAGALEGFGARVARPHVYRKGTEPDGVRDRDRDQDRDRDRNRNCGRGRNRSPRPFVGAVGGR
ncbi:FUSC family protein [Streptomyces vinaceus]|uniref:FUSC family protein n=1 Tax=Streptomyces vinaceus TaxID=1960 RepID=UPI0036B5DBDA